MLVVPAPLLDVGPVTSTFVVATPLIAVEQQK
jgi:hypothetical protein